MDVGLLNSAGWKARTALEDGLRSLTPNSA